MKKHSNIECDPLASLLCDSILERDPQRAEEFTQRVVCHLPKRRGGTALTWIFTFVRSPFWLITALLVCGVVVSFRMEGLMAVIESAQDYYAFVLFFLITLAFFTVELFYDARATSDALA